MKQTKEEMRRKQKNTKVVVSVAELHDFTMQEIERWIMANMHPPVPMRFTQVPSYYGFRKRLQLFLLELREKEENKTISAEVIADLTGLHLRSLADIRKGIQTRRSLEHDTNTNQHLAGR